jgi:hypothetical protein
MIFFATWITYFIHLDKIFFWSMKYFVHVDEKYHHIVGEKGQEVDISFGYSRMWN